MWGREGNTNNFKVTEHDSAHTHTHTAATGRHKAESESLTMKPEVGLLKHNTGGSVGRCI